jgi:hypothetical protein
MKLPNQLICAYDIRTTVALRILRDYMTKCYVWFVRARLVV